MKVGVVGAGSIGLLFAAYLSRKFDVTVYTRTKAQAKEINTHGILVKKGAGRKEYLVNALPFGEWQAREDLSIITVKQYQLAGILAKINQWSALPKNLLFLQNGMAHLQQIETILNGNLFVGSVEHGATRENFNTVSHNGMGVTNVAVFRGDLQPLRQFIAAAPKDFPFVYQEQYNQMLVKKLIVNAVINPLTAILEVNNGALIDNFYYYQVAEKLFKEITLILALKNESEYFQQVLDICRKTADNRSSMLKDIEANRVTEIDAILGYILAEAKRQKKEAPLCQSLYLLIKGKETNKGGIVA